ncbi:MAG: ABC transporter ATP-binding protein [Spirochaetales bacterium]|nr:ABC transporter ATP-binding protein [Spirochaetales bacterium]
MSEIVLRYEAVSKEYLLGETVINALSDVSLAVNHGEFSALVGPSGSGKSTLLHLGAGLDRPTGGRVHLLGKRLHDVGEKGMARVRNREVGFIFQTFNLIPVLNVRENVEYPSLLYPEVKKNRARVMELLEKVGIADQADKRPHMLSGGQRQRVAIARALINDPNVVFADEPTANLDHRTGDSIMRLLEELNRSFGTTFLYSTHDEKIMARAKRIISLEDGKIVSDTAGPESRP